MFNRDLTDAEVVELEKLVVKLHYQKRLDIYSLCSVHEPELYKKNQNKLKIPRSTRWAVWRRDEFICVYCGSDETALTLDHVIPEEAGGSFDIDNLVTSCHSCNQKKQNMTREEFENTPWLIRKKKQLAAQFARRDSRKHI